MAPRRKPLYKRPAPTADRQEPSLGMTLGYSTQLKSLIDILIISIKGQYYLGKILIPHL